MHFALDADSFFGYWHGLLNRFPHQRSGNSFISSFQLFFFMFAVYCVSLATKFLSDPHVDDDSGSLWFLLGIWCCWIITRSFLHSFWHGKWTSSWSN